MSIHYQAEGVTLHHGDCIEVMRELPDDSVDAVVTDPPYGLGFMGKEWDDLPPGPEFAAEAFRLLKPGGHMLAFGGTRTWHRLAVAVEDAGFEIRDSIAWLYSTGFPKSLNVSKDERVCQCDRDNMRGMRGDVSDVAADSASGQESHLLTSMQWGEEGAGVGSSRGEGSGREDSGTLPFSRGEDARREEPCMEGRSHKQASEGELHTRANRAMSTGSRVHDDGERVCEPSPSGHGPMGGPSAHSAGVRESQGSRHIEQRAVEPGAVPDEPGPQVGGVWPVCERCSKPVVTPGLGTALKPAFEPVVVARKPLGGSTVAANVLRYGTGALNIDATRIAHRSDADLAESTNKNRHAQFGTAPGQNNVYGDYSQTPMKDYDGSRGRWPSNVVLDGDTAEHLDRMSGVTKSPPVGSVAVKSARLNQVAKGDEQARVSPNGHGDEGGASRFFPVFRYEPKAPSSERPNVEGTMHATVKPLELMRWLVRLVTPPGGVVLEPFAGSGTTLEAALVEGFACIGIEREAEYLPLIMQRISKPLQQSLFGDWGTP